MRAQDDFKGRFGRNAEVWSPVVGTGLSLLLALLTWLMATGRGRAMRLASEMTSELRESEEKFRAIADCTVNWEVWWGQDGKPRWINPSVKDYTGYTVEECMAMPDLAGTLDRSRRHAPRRPRIPEGTPGLSRRRPRIPLRSQGWNAGLAVRFLVPIADARGVLTGSGRADATSPTASKSKPNCALRRSPSTRSKP